MFSRQWPGVGVLQREPGAQVPPESPPLRQRPPVAAPAHGSQMSLLHANSCVWLHVDVGSDVDIPPDPT